MRSLGLVSRIVASSRAEVVRFAIVEFAGVIWQMGPITIVGTNRFIAHALYHSMCVVLCSVC